MRAANSNGPIEGTILDWVQDEVEKGTSTPEIVATLFTLGCKLVLDMGGNPTNCHGVTDHALAKIEREDHAVN